MRSLLCLSLLALIPMSAEAVDWHVGAAATDDYDQRTPDFGARVDTKNGRSLFGGVRFDSGFGIEASWLDLGQARSTAVADAGYRVDGKLWSLGVTYAPDTGPLQPYAKLGWFDRDEDGTFIGIAGPVPVSYDDDGLAAEVGGRWFVTRSFALRLGYSWFDFDPDSDGSVLFGAEWHFR
ncbi:outer membrane beta-barrel protein [Pseudomarimonas salicorniae]|uniref:Porin family protein n=1 Tax=Pseudomarimonas salicorniae TaxID=2933270 RepID=A0ABT0GHQ6_9GAMM|nr:outer membrane beta-barrel protein [Lysobacter sp. CAU 1642]MCK7594079.1 porin family protein [Lysobacter sp. CAU 1642]